MSERTCLLYQISAVGAPRHYVHPRRVTLPGSPDDLSIDRPVTEIPLRFAPSDYAAGRPGSFITSNSLTESSFVPFLQNAAQPVDPLCPIVIGRFGLSIREWLGQNTTDGLVSLGEIQVQH